MARPMIARADTKEVLIAEPVHGTGYLPLYIGMAKNLFEDVDGQDRHHRDRRRPYQCGAVRRRPSPSSAARSIAPSPRSRAPSCAPWSTASTAATSTIARRRDRSRPDTDWPGYFKGKTIATSGFGGTPNSITRYLLKKWNLDATKDVTLVETANSAILPAVRGKQAQIGCSTEPFITQGVRTGVWSEPFINIPKDTGPLRLLDLQRASRHHPERSRSWCAASSAA